MIVCSVGGRVFDMRNIGDRVLDRRSTGGRILDRRRSRPTMVSYPRR